MSTNKEIFNKCNNLIPKVRHLAIMVTDRCNLNCYHCFRFNSDFKKDIDIQRIKQLIKKLKNTSIESVRLTGGEPFLIPELIDLIIAFKKIGLYISIVTNGTLLDTNYLKKIKSSNLDALWFSVHSVKEKIHDRLVGKKGSCKLMKKALMESINIGITTNVYFPVAKQNIMDVNETLAWLDIVGVSRIKILRLSPLGKASYANGFKHLTQKEWSNLGTNILRSINFNKSSVKIQGLLNKEENNYNKGGTCTVLPFKHINIHSLGQIYPCCLLNGKFEFSIGHIDELLAGDWNITLALFFKRIKEKYKSIDDGLLPCLDSRSQIINKRLCPLSSKFITNETQ